MVLGSSPQDSCGGRHSDVQSQLPYYGGEKNWASSWISGRKEGDLHNGDDEGSDTNLFESTKPNTAPEGGRHNIKDNQDPIGVDYIKVDDNPHSQRNVDVSEED